MSERISILKIMFKRINNFNVGTSEGRIVIQKTAYFLQAFGLDLGYSFSWYIHGPYSIRLMAEAFDLDKRWDSIKERPLSDAENEALERIFLFLGDRKDDHVWLEILASIHYIKNKAPSLGKSEVMHDILAHQEYFTEKDFLEAWDYLSKFNGRVDQIA